METKHKGSRQMETFGPGKRVAAPLRSQAQPAGAARRQKETEGGRPLPSETEWLEMFAELRL